MFIAHLPASYLLTCPWRKYLNTQAIGACIIGGVFPDFDMFYFYLVDQRATHHHLYWTHLPIFWLFLALAAIDVVLATKREKWKLPLFFFFVGVVLHMCLDSIAGPIYWLYPFSSTPIHLVHVPVVHDWWVWNFVLHWSFMLEIGICTLWLGYLVLSRRFS